MYSPCLRRGAGRWSARTVDAERGPAVHTVVAAAARPRRTGHHPVAHLEVLDPAPVRRRRRRSRGRERCPAGAPLEVDVLVGAADAAERDLHHRFARPASGRDARPCGSTRLPRRARLSRRGLLHRGGALGGLALRRGLALGRGHALRRGLALGRGPPSAAGRPLRPPEPPARRCHRRSPARAILETGSREPAVIAQDRLGPLELLGHEAGHFGVDEFLGVRTEMAVVLDGAGQVAELLARVLTEPSLSLMPNSVIMRRASSVAFWMSSLAPVLMVPSTVVSAAARPTSRRCGRSARSW